MSAPALERGVELRVAYVAHGLRQRGGARCLVDLARSVRGDFLVSYLGDSDARQAGRPPSG